MTGMPLFTSIDFLQEGSMFSTSTLNYFMLYMRQEDTQQENTKVDEIHKNQPFWSRIFFYVLKY